jgi:hypothetical protein
MNEVEKYPGRSVARKLHWRNLLPPLRCNAIRNLAPWQPMGIVPAAGKLAGIIIASARPYADGHDLGR